MNCQELAPSDELLVATWNVRGRIAEAETQRQIFASQADIFVLPEICAEGTPIPDEVYRAFRREGYLLHTLDYEDDDDRKDRHQLGVAVDELLYARVEPLDLSSRMGRKIILPNGAEIAAVHLDDRREDRRVQQTEALLRSLGANAIAAGDLNTMPPKSAVARMLRLARPFTHLLPAQDPVPGERTPRLQRLGSLSQRLAAMALGGAMKLLTAKSEGFVDAFGEDTTHTLQKGPFKAQLDHILYRGNIHLLKPSEVTKVAGFDHAIVRALFRLAAQS